MRIFSLIFTFLCIASAPSFGADAQTMQQFILRHGGSQQIISQLEAADNAQRCFSTPGFLVCVAKKKYPKLESNPLARQSILAGMAIRIKNDLYSEMLNSVSASNLQNKKEAASVYLEGVNSSNSRYLLKGMEFSTYFSNGICYAFAAAPKDSSLNAIEQRLHAPFFIGDYCKSLYPKAQTLMQKQEYEDALVILKELHDLKFAHIDAYLLASKAFLQTGQSEDAKKIALELLTDFETKMTVQQAEDLGDLFMGLGEEKYAEKAYDLALARG